MAKMFPECLREDVESPAERRLYKAFQKQLSDDFTVLHQVSWVVRNRCSGAKDGETDFVIACPNLGILVIEVKGGPIRYDSTADKWYSNDNHIKDPFKQACHSKHSLLSLLKEQGSGQRWIPIGHAVAFPDVKVNRRLRLDAPHEIVLDRTQLRNLSAWVADVMNHWRDQDKPKGDLDAIGIQELVSILSPSIDLKPQLSRTIVAQTQELKRLSSQQLRILDFLGRQRRAAISGCAGSGKTLLAVEKARRLSQQGFQVLLTCYNKGLAHFLRKSLAREKNLYVYNFHALCEKLAHQAGCPPAKDQYSDSVLFDEIYPRLLVDSAQKLNWRVDAVIVDEGQDFRENWWQALKCLLDDPDNGIFYLFYDDNQNIFGRDWRPPVEQAPFPLTENWRNTQKIHSHVLQFYNGQNSTTALGPVGQDVEILDYTSDTHLKQILSDLLHRLVVEEGVATKDIVILTTTRKQTLQNKFLGDFLVKADPDTNTKEILCNTIHHFKGLESPVVILVETDLRNVSNMRNLLYVGTSRSRHHLIIVQQDLPF